jgi:hypothetical protein
MFKQRPETIAESRRLFCLTLFDGEEQSITQSQPEVILCRYTRRRHLNWHDAHLNDQHSDTLPHPAATDPGSSARFGRFGRATRCRRSTFQGDSAPDFDMTFGISSVGTAARVGHQKTI